MSEIYWHASEISLDLRERQNGHRSACIWLTGLSGSGKSTIAVALEKVLFEKGLQTYVLDGDNIRHGLNKDLGFSDQDRTENIRRIGEVARLLVDAGMLTVTAFISPFRQDRTRVRSIFHKGQFVEIYVHCDLDTCRRRDPKGLYAKADRGSLANFTGISSSYEPPESPELILENSDNVTVEQNVHRVLQYLIAQGLIPGQE